MGTLCKSLKEIIVRKVPVTSKRRKYERYYIFKEYQFFGKFSCYWSIRREQIDAKKEKDIRCLLEAIEKKLDCQKFVTPIFKKDIPYHITKPGQYCLAEDSVFTPTSSGTQAIQISASNVTLDLNDKTLSNGDLSKTFVNVNGIFIDANQSNITIKRGTVTGFSQAGIFANGSLLTGGVSLT